MRKNGKAPVEISVIVNGERQMWQLPKKCSPDEFKTNTDIKLFCTSVENKINEIYTNLSINDETITAFIIKDIYQNGSSKKSYTLKQMFEDGLKTKAMDNKNIGTYNKYKFVINYFYQFTGLNEKQEARAVNHSHIMAFKGGIESIHQPQTVCKEMQMLKYYFNLAMLNGKLSQNPFGAMKIKSGKVDKPYLTHEEVMKIKDLQLTSDRLDKVRDLFLFMCFTGLEWADIVNLKPDDVKHNEYHQYYIKKKRIKTGVEYVTILYENAYEIWDFYDHKLPIPSPQKFNKYMKEIADLAGIDKKVTSLTARHSFACYIFNNCKLSLEICQKMMGHSTPVQTLHYAKMFEHPVFEANIPMIEQKEKPATKQIEADEYDEAWGSDKDEYVKKLFATLSPSASCP